MKTRNGFVSNSSSTSFILDLRNPGVKKLVSKIIAKPAEGLDRSTAMSIGSAAVDYAKEWIEETKGWYENDVTGLGHWILKWAEELGEENIVFLRESDEGSGGYLFEDGDKEEEFEEETKHKKDYETLYKLALDKREYH